MSSYTSITTDKLSRLIGTANTPALIDVRTDADFANGHGKISSKEVADTALGEEVPAHARPPISWSLKVAGVGLLLWFVPILGLLALLGPGNVFTDIAILFSKMEMVTFGGAYAVLAYVAQQSLWLVETRRMLDGLGMAETTPGPADHGYPIRRLHGGLSGSGFAPSGLHSTCCSESYESFVGSA